MPKNALTQSASPTMGLADLLGDAKGQPPDAANILAAAHRARKAKDTGDRETWRDEVNEILWTARKSQLTQEKKTIDLEKKSRDELNKVYEKMSENELQLRMFRKNLNEKVVKAIEQGNDSLAFKLMAAGGGDAKLHEQFGERMYHEDALKANAGDPEAQKRIRTVKALEGQDQKTVGMIYFDLFWREKMDAAGDPTITGRVSAPSFTQDQQMMLPPGIDTGITSGRQASIDTYLGQPSQSPTLPMMEQMYTPTRGPMSTQDYENYLTAQGIQPKAQPTQPRASDEVQFIEFAQQNGKTYDEAISLWQDLQTKQQTERGLTGDAALLQQLRQEFPEATMEELRPFFTSAGGRHASAPPAIYDEVPEQFRHAFDALAINDKSAQGQQGLERLANALVDYNMSDTDDTDKMKKSVGLFKNYVDNTITSATERVMIEGQQNMLDTLNHMDQYLMEHPSGIDPNAPGLWQGSLHAIAGAFGITVQPELTSLQSVTKDALVNWIRSISGAAVTDAERSFLQSFFINIMDGHKVNKARIDGFRAVVGRRMRNFYRNRLTDDFVTTEIAKQIVGGDFNKGYFDRDGNFNYYDAEKPKPRAKQDGSMGDIEGMPSLKETKTDPMFMKKWNGYTRSQRKSLVDVLIRDHGTDTAKQLLMDAGVSESDLSDFLGEN